MRSFHNVAVVATILLAAGMLAALTGHGDAGSGLALAAVVQSTYSERIPPAVAGMFANMRNWDAETRNVETSAGIGFGLALGQGALPDGATLGASAANKFVGISLRDITLVNGTVLNTTADKYALNQNLGCATLGDIWVNCDGAVTAGQDVTFNSTTGALGTIAADGTHFTIAGARWMTTQSVSGGLAQVRLTGALPGA